MKKSYQVIKYDEIYSETEKAYQIKFDNKLYWFPKSQVIVYKVSKKIEIPDWLYYKIFNPGE